MGQRPFFDLGFYPRNVLGSAQVPAIRSRRSARRRRGFLLFELVGYPTAQGPRKNEDPKLGRTLLKRATCVFLGTNVKLYGYIIILLWRCQVLWGNVDESRKGRKSRKGDS